jgi:hypothetical protein
MRTWQLVKKTNNEEEAADEQPVMVLQQRLKFRRRPVHRPLIARG